MPEQRKKLLFVLAAAAVFFLLAEIPLRLFGLDHTSEEKFYEDVFDPLYGMIPGASNPYAAMSEFMNDQGLRGMNFERRKRPGDFRIVCLGDSTTFGLGEYGNSYPKLLEDILNTGRPTLPYEVINAGIPGTGLYQQRLHFARIFGDADVDLVLVMTNANYRADLKLYRDRMKTPFFRVLNGMQSALSHSAVYRFLRIRIKTTRARVSDDAELAAENTFLAKEYIADYHEDLTIMRDMSRRRGIRLVFLGAINREYIGHLRELELSPGQPDYVEKAKAAHSDTELVYFCKDEKVPYIDISRDFVPYDPDTPGLWNDPNHPGDFGNRLIAQRVAAELRASGLLSR